MGIRKLIKKMSKKVGEKLINIVKKRDTVPPTPSSPVARLSGIGPTPSPTSREAFPAFVNRDEGPFLDD